MDLLSAAIGELGVRSTRFEAQTQQAPWSWRSSSAGAALYLVRTGRVVAQLDEHVTSLGAGDALIVLRAEAHALGAPRSARRGDVAEWVGGAITLSAAEHPMLDHLPPSIVVPRPYIEEHPAWEAYATSLAREVAAPQRGSHLVQLRLAEILLVEAVRRAADEAAECPRAGWLQGLRDEAIRRSLQALHGRPERRWSVASLAREAGLSRTAFAERFRSTMGEAPVSYVRRWQMFRTRDLLRTTSLSLDEIALRTGYGSAAALSLAFSREHGTTPGAFRKSG